MKKITILLLLALLTIRILNAESLSFTNSREDTPIDLFGDMVKTGTRTLDSSPPISVFKHSGYLEVTMSKFLGKISIEIFDDTNQVVYNETVDSAIQSDFYIDTAFYGVGEYEIQFTNSLGQYLYGFFVIE